MKRLNYLFFLAVFISTCGSIAPAPTSTPTPTKTLIVLDTLTPTITFIPTETSTPTPLPTLFYEPTPTATALWTTCPLVVTPIQDGYTIKLHILRCEDGLEYDLGPFERGTYAAGPNNRFILFVTLTGKIYGARIGDKYPRVLVDLERQKTYTAINKNLDPKFIITFIGGDPFYKLILVEKRYDEKNSFTLPLQLTQ